MAAPLIYDALETPHAVCARLAQALQAAGAAGAPAWRVRRLADYTIRSCTGCFGCWIRTPGLCVQSDDGNRFLRELYEADLVAFVVPVVFGTYGALFKTALERMLPLSLPFFSRVRRGAMRLTSHPARYAREAPMIVIGIEPQAEPGDAAVFQDLVRRLGEHMNGALACALLQGSENDLALGRLAADLLRRVGGGRP